MRIEAAAGLARDRVGVMSGQCGLGEARPHPLVDHAGLRLRDDERAQVRKWLGLPADDGKGGPAR